MNQSNPSLTNSPVVAGQTADLAPKAEPTTTDREELTRRVFASFAAAIGSRLAQLWEGTNRAHVSDVWTRALVEFTQQDLEAACSAFVDSGDDWPPGLPRYKAMCAVAKQRREAEIARRRQGQLALTSHNSDEARALVEDAARRLTDHQGRRPDVIDGKWAEAAIARHESGERRLMPDALKIARDALARHRDRQKPTAPPDPGAVVDPAGPAPSSLAAPEVRA